MGFGEGTQKGFEGIARALHCILLVQEVIGGFGPESSVVPRILDSASGCSAAGCPGGRPREAGGCEEEKCGWVLDLFLECRDNRIC